MLVLLAALAALTIKSAEAEADFGIMTVPAEPLYRRDQTICDPVSQVFICERGTCYWGADGFVGCCSVSSCAPRTTCIEYAQASEVNCDHNTGGCVICSRAEAPYCATNTNVAMGHYAMYCNSERFVRTWDYEYSWPGVIATPTAVDEEGEETETSRPASRSTITTTPTSSPTSDIQTTETHDTEQEASQTELGDGGDSQTETPCCQPSDDARGGDGNEDEDKGGVNIAAIVGGVLGGVLGLILIGIAILCLQRRGRRERPISTMTTSTAQRPMAFATPQASPMIPQPSPPSSFQPSPTSPQNFPPHGRNSVAGYSQAPPSYYATTPPFERPFDPAAAFGRPMPMDSVHPHYQSPNPAELDGQGRWVPRHELEDRQTAHRLVYASDMAGREPRGPQY